MTISFVHQFHFIYNAFMEVGSEMIDRIDLNVILFDKSVSRISDKHKNIRT